MSESEHQPPPPRANGALAGRPQLLEAVLAEIAGLVAVNEPLAPGLRELADQQSPGPLQQALRELADCLADGNPLPAALQFSGAPAVVVAAAEAGLRGGHLGDVLQDLVQHRRRLLQVHRLLLAPLAYPTILLLITALLSGVLLAVFTPQFENIYGDFGTELPALTTLILSIGGFLREYGIPVLAILATGIVFLMFWQVSRPLSLTMTDGLRWMPGVSAILRRAEWAWLARLLAVLQRCEVPLPTALELAAPVARDSYNRSACRQLASTLREGRFPNSLPFSSVLMQHLQTHGSTGDTADLLELQAGLVEARLLRQVCLLQVLIEPAMIVIVGSGIGIGVSACLMPMFKLLNVLS